MELELCLSLSNSSPKFPIMKELDLISFVNCDSKRFCDDNSTLTSQSSVNGGDENDGFVSKKRGWFGFDEVESSVSSKKTLPLFCWDRRDPNQNDDDPERLCNFSAFDANKNEEGIVGWPPVKSFRRNFCHQGDAQNPQQRRREENPPAAENGGGHGGPPSMFVKAQMKGNIIIRKIDLELHQSYDSLIHTLLTMFGKGHDCVGDYKLTYQDKEGDWLLAGDVPWRTFTQSVQRLKLMKRDA